MLHRVIWRVRRIWLQRVHQWLIKSLRFFVKQAEIKGSKSGMNRVISVEQDLGLLANLAARLLETPVATITLYDSDDDGGTDMVDTISHAATSCDESWAASHPGIDIKQLGSPRNAMTQHLGLYASVPIRNGNGGTIGMVACADDEAKDLGEEGLATLKHIAAIASAVAQA